MNDSTVRRQRPRSARPTLTALEGRDVPAVAYAVTAANALIRFDTATPGVTQRSVALAGLQAGDQIAGIDFRIRTGQLYALAVHDTPGPDEGRVYRVDPNTGTCTVLGPPFLVALADGASYGFEADPVRDTLRVVNSAGQNLEVSLTTGALIGVRTALHFGDDTPASVVGLAYRGGLNPGTHALLDLMGIETTTNSLVRFGGITSDEDSGGVAIALPLGVTPVNANIGFDYLRDGQLGFAAIATAAGTGLYRLTVAPGSTTAFTLVGPIAGATAAGVRGFALALPLPAQTAVGAGPGGGPQVNLYAADGSLVRAFNAYDPSFRGGVRVAMGDFTGDGLADVVTAPGPGGGPDVRVWDGATGFMLSEFLAYAADFTGGVNVAVGDINMQGGPEIVTAPGVGGGPHVRTFTGAGALLGEFFAYDAAFRGGVSVAVGDATNDGVGDIVTGAGPGGGPHVKVYFGASGMLASEFLAFDATFTGGVVVAVADRRVVVAPQAGGGPVVRTFTAAGMMTGEFLAYGAAFRGGITVAAGDVDGDGAVEIVTGAGTGGGPHVEAFTIAGVVERSFLAFDPAFQGGVFVG